MKKSAGVIVKSGNKCLLCKRSNVETYSGEWSIPGGKVEPGEEIIDAANREFYEETNKTLTGELEFVGVMSRMNRKGTKQSSMMYVFLIDVDKPIHPDLENAEYGEEHSECGYFSIDNLPEPLAENLKEHLINVLK
jgi:ADP-ribose pyrophosphatase YjhB (NUDIX family)